jgi:hypothetical protein
MSSGQRLLELLLQPQRRQYRPLGVILLRHRHSKHDEHSLPYHWLDSPAIPPRLMLDQIVEHM